MKHHYIVNYALNKFCPYLVIGLLLFLNTETDPIRAIIILASCIFVDKFSFNTGYSVAYCKSNGIKLQD